MTTRRHFLQRAATAGIASALFRSLPAASASNPPRRLRVQAGTAQTVLGPIDAAKLGFTLSHEHIADAPAVLERWPAAWGGRDGLIDRAVGRLREVKAAGVLTVVDLTTYDSGRDIRFLEQVARGSGLNLIASTGQRFLPPRSDRATMPSRTIQGLADFFVTEIDLGIDGTDLKAGVIKLGIVGAHPTRLEEVGLRAAARAARATGVPIRVHCDARQRAAGRLAAILEDEGMQPGRVSFDHSDDGSDMDYLLGLLRRGYALSMDHVHRGLAARAESSFEQRLERIRRIVDAGFAGQLFVSSDTELGGWLLPAEARDWREGIDPPEGMFFVPQTLLPRLATMGVSSEQVRTMTVEHPREFFARRAPA